MPSLPPSWKREIQETIEERANADRQERQTEQSNASTKITAAINALRDAQQTQTAHEDRNENINIGLAIVTIVLVFLTVVFTGLSWLVFRDQSITLKEQLASFDSEAHVRLRAYLSTAITSLPTLEVGKERDIGITIQAGGQTPTIDMSAWAGYRIDENPFNPTMEFTKYPSTNKATLNPGNTIGLFLKTPPLDQATVDLIKVKQTRRLYVWGEQHFTDVFGCKRWVTFCFSIDDTVAPPRADNCSNHNDMDTPPGACPK